MSIIFRNQADSIAQYLPLIDSSRVFTTSTLQSLIKDRRITHRECINTSHNIVRLQPNNIVMDRTEVKGHKCKVKVLKLSYQVSGSFRILKFIGQGSYIV